MEEEGKFDKGLEDENPVSSGHHIINHEDESRIEGVASTKAEETKEPEAGSKAEISEAEPETEVPKPESRNSAP